MKSFLLSKWALVIVFMLAPLVFASATHLRGGYIHVERVDQNSLQFQITLVVFTNTGNSAVKVGGISDVSYLYFGDGTRIFVPETLPVALPDMPGIGEARFVVSHTYSSYQQFKITYQEPNRDAGIVNASQTVNSLFYLETMVNVDPYLDHIGKGVVATPAPVMPPVFRGAIKNNFTASLASSGAEGFSSFYTLSRPLKGDHTPLDDYDMPERFEINGFNGQITWDTQFRNGYFVGEYAFAVRIHQYSGEYKVSEVLVDFQVILADEGTHAPMLTDNLTLDENNRIYLPDGTSRTIRIFAEDAASTSIRLLAYSDMDGLYQGGAFQFSEYDSTEGDRHIHVGLLKLACYAEIVRVAPYSVSIRGQFQRAGGWINADRAYLVYTTDTELEYPYPVLATDDDDADALRVYPNPVGDFLYLDWHGARAVKLYSTEGELLVEGTAVDVTAIDFRNRKPGIYFLQYERADKGSRVVKLVKR